jgi:hypothetical protein
VTTKTVAETRPAKRARPTLAGRTLALATVFVVLVTSAGAATPSRRFGPLPGQRGKSASVLITVRDALGGRPVANAGVALGVTGKPCCGETIREPAIVETLHVATDRKGRARYEGIPPGCVMLSAWSAGHREGCARSFLRPGERGKLTVTLHTPGTVGVLVRAAGSGRPLPASVRGSRDGTSAGTDSTGRAVLTGLWDGKHEFCVSSPGYLPAQIAVEVSQDRRGTLVVELLQQPPQEPAQEPTGPTWVTDVFPSSPVGLTVRLVSGSARRPVHGLIVCLQDAAGKTHTSTTDSLGMARIDVASENGLSGLMRVWTPDTLGLERAEFGIEVQEGSSTLVELPLRRNSPPRAPTGKARRP